MQMQRHRCNDTGAISKLVAVGAVPADNDVQRSEGPRQGVRCLRGDRRGRRCGGLAARGCPDRVPDVAVDAVGARSQPGRRVCGHAHRRRRHVRDLPVPDLVPAADIWLLAGRHRFRRPAHRGRHRRRGEPVHHRGDAEDRAEAAGRDRDAGSSGRGGVVRAPGRAHRLRGLGQQLGASIGTSLLNTIFASAVTSYVVAHAASARMLGRQSLTALALAPGYDTAFWWTAGIFAGGAVICGSLLRRGPLYRNDTPTAQPAGVRAVQAEAGPAVSASAGGCTEVGVSEPNDSEL